MKLAGVSSFYETHLMHELLGGLSVVQRFLQQQQQHPVAGKARSKHGWSIEGDTVHFACASTSTRHRGHSIPTLAQYRGN